MRLQRKQGKQAQQQQYYLWLVLDDEQQNKRRETTSCSTRSSPEVEFKASEQTAATKQRSEKRNGLQKL